MRPFEALIEGQSLDGREGLELFAPSAWEQALQSAEDEARYWGRGAAPSAELEQILAHHDSSEEGRIALYSELSAFTQRHLGMTETWMRPGLQVLQIDGDQATAQQIGENPGGKFRVELHFVRIDGQWYRDLP